MGLKFEWDKRKAKTNIQKHDVSFEEASTVLATHWRISLMTKSTLKTKTEKLSSDTLHYRDY